VFSLVSDSHCHHSARHEVAQKDTALNLLNKFNTRTHGNIWYAECFLLQRKEYIFILLAELAALLKDILAMFF